MSVSSRSTEVGSRFAAGTRDRCQAVRNPRGAYQLPDEGDLTQVTDKAQDAPPADLILSEDEVARRMLLLAKLQNALTAQGVCCVLARNHRLILRYSVNPWERSGMTEPKLHLFMPTGRDIATTDGTTYRLASGAEFAVADPVFAAVAIRRSPQTPDGASSVQADNGQRR